MPVICAFTPCTHYPIVVENGHYARLPFYLKSQNLGHDALIITNPVVWRLHGRALQAGLNRSRLTTTTLTVADTERSKSARCAMSLLERIAKIDLKKGIFLVAFGGGVVGDLAGYVAAVYKRGVPYIQIPTTLLAQIDSAIGGKVGIDLSVGKNLVGAFYQPKLVYSDIAVLKTLGLRQIRNGLAEAVKYGVISDPRLFIFLERHYQDFLRCDSKVLETIVAWCSRIKAAVVARDEKETKGIRTILNFGHTVGHAIETAGHYSLYQHGEAIGLGMRIAVDISRQLGYLSTPTLERIGRLLTNIGLPENIQRLKMDDILKAMAHDKKFKDGRNRLVLARGLGRVFVREDVPMNVIKKAILRATA